MIKKAKVDLELSFYFSGQVFHYVPFSVFGFSFSNNCKFQVISSLS